MSKNKASEPTMRKRMALYARVSTQEQTKGNYPSCTSQIEELEAYCRSREWQVFERITDDGISAGSLNRKGLSHMRHLVTSGQIDGVVCTWYDRLVRTRDFYVLDKEFRESGVEFLTLHDPTDRHTASGRFLETMLVAAKTYEREQTGEKVRTKMRMRKEKGLWNGGLVPFGFRLEEKTQLLLPDEEKKTLIEQIFRIYVDTRSDFKVRDWLRARGVPAPGGKVEWTPSSIRDLLMNRRYIGEIEINPSNKGREETPEFETYRIFPAPHTALVSKELWETAQGVRRERATQSPHRGGKGKGQSYSRNQCGRVYLLQSNLVCGLCGAAMSPHYVFHKPNEKEKRRTASYIYHYTCAEKMKYRQAVGHSNRVLARVAEAWVLDAIEEMVTSEVVIEGSLQVALEKVLGDLQPVREALSGCRSALDENKRRIDQLVETAAQAPGALLELLNEKAHVLKMEREQLKAEQRRLESLLLPLNTPFDANKLRHLLSNFAPLRSTAEPEELQRLLRLLVRRVAWMPGGEHRVQFFLPTSKPTKNRRDDGTGTSFGTNHKHVMDQTTHWFETPAPRAATTSHTLEPVFIPG